MHITDIKIRKLGNYETRLRAMVSVTFQNAFVVHEIKIIQGKDRLFVAMPNRRTNKGQFKDIAHPINSETRSYLESAILSKYECYLQENGDKESVESEDEDFL